MSDTISVTIPSATLEKLLLKIESGKPCHCSPETKQLRAHVLATLIHAQHPESARIAGALDTMLNQA